MSAAREPPPERMRAPASEQEPYVWLELRGELG